MRYVLVLLLAAGCGARAARPTLEPPLPEPSGPAAPVDLGRLPGWSGPDASATAPVRFVPSPGGATLQALVLTRDVADDRELLLVVARLGGEVMTTAPLARIRVGGASRREVTAALVRWPLGGGQTGLRADLSVFELSPPRRFAIKAVLVDATGGQARIILDRVVESGDDVRDRRATLAAKDVDGDGAAELVVDERETGARRRTLVYRRAPGGRYETRDPSLFDD